MPVSEVDRGAVWNERQQNLFRITNDVFNEVDADGFVTPLNGLEPFIGTGQGSLPYSFNTQAVIIGGRYYLYDPVGGFRRITDPDLGVPIDCVWVDGYYFFTDGEYLFHTDLDDEEAIDPLKFATSEFSPDPTLGVGLTPDDKVIAFNRYTTEYFVNQANPQFAFTRLSGRTVMAGIVATHAKVRIDGTYYCLGGSKESDVTVFALGTGSVQNIATREVNKVIGQYTEADLQGVVMEGRTVDNYTYLLIHLPDEVLMLNLTLMKAVGPDQAWSILVSGSEATEVIPYRAINGAFDPRRAQWVYGDKYTTGRSYLDPSVATHVGEIAQCAVFTPFVYLETASIDELEIETIPGFTTTDDAQVFLSLTYDGVTFGTEVPVEYGAPSEYTRRFMARRLGYVTNWFSMKFRWASESRMAFALAKLTFS